MPKFEGTFESPVVPVRGPFTSLIALTSGESEGTSALQKTPDGTSNILFSFAASGSQTPNTKVEFELYEDVEAIYKVLQTWSTTNSNKLETLSAATILPYHWRLKVVQGSPLATIYVNFQYI